jgi:hypothetical protein
VRYLDRLASFARVTQMDFRGADLSDALEGAVTLEALADDVVAVAGKPPSSLPLAKVLVRGSFGTWWSWGEPNPQRFCDACPGQGDSPSSAAVFE